jgi:hypothetical protein
MVKTSPSILVDGIKIVAEVQVETTINLVVVVDLYPFNLGPKWQVFDMNIFGSLIFSLFVGICEECHPEILSIILALDLIVAEKLRPIDLIRNILRCPFYDVLVKFIVVQIDVWMLHPMRILACSSVHFGDDGRVAPLWNVIYRNRFVKDIISDLFSIFELI